MTPSAKIRKQLGHPVIDGDAHMLEAEPILFDYIREIGGPAVFDRCQTALRRSATWYGLSAAERKSHRQIRPPWGMRTSNARDLATVMLPKMLYDRLDDIGIDFCIQLPTLGLLLSRQADEEARRQACRALNTYSAEMYKGLGDRLCPAALIPMHTPDEAIAELDHAVLELGHKVIVIDCATARPIPVVEDALRSHPELAHVAARSTYLDSYGLDSPYDYDPLWARCEELKVAVCGHTGGHWGTRRSISNYVHNHLGLFASGGDALCRSLLMGGVMHRFSRLNVGFLEGGIAWGAALLADLIEHWEKRRPNELHEFDIKALDVAALEGYWREHGMERLGKGGSFADAFPGLFAMSGWSSGLLEDEFAAVHVESKKQLRNLFTSRFYFGCEADDKMISVAFDERLHNGRLRPFFGSDIGHWDVENLETIVAEAYGLVKKSLLDDRAFKRFVFENAAWFHATNNPSFFAGTVVEKEVAALLASAD